MAISAAGLGPWSPAPCTWPLAFTQLRSVSTAIALVQGPRRAGSERYAATYHLCGRSELHAAAFAPGAALRHTRASSSSGTPSLGKLGVPVLPASQSKSRQRRASNTCSQAVREVPARCAVRQPAQDHLGRLARHRAPAAAARGSSASPPARAARRATPRTESTRCGRRNSAWPLAAAASVAIMPATPSALARAWPWPQPSAAMSTTPPPRHFSQSSSLRRAPSAPAAQRRTIAGSNIAGGIRRIAWPTPRGGSLISRP